MITINGSVLSIGKFPNNESWIDSTSINYEGYGTINVGFKYESDEDILHLSMIKQYLDEHSKRTKRINIYYMPYSRMDRYNNKYVFTLKYISNFINTLKFDEVRIYEPHSDVTPALINNCVIVNMSMHLAITCMEKHKIDYVYFPDAGAQKRYSDYFTIPSFVGFKKRNFSTGDITGLDIIGDYDVQDKNIMIIDDLCSKGGSFYHPAKQFKERGAWSVYLVVTHCEDNIFNGELLSTPYIDEIYTTDSILNKEHEKINIKGIVS